ncbi:MAG: deoxyguanosinetriphosphate triphosphohydrolase [Planctomycetota bacterium]|jgi:dGTPase
MSAPAPKRREFSWNPQRAPYAVSESESGGRNYPEPDHPYRTCFQRDRDRIVHCSAFRRLDFKTQVFVPHEHDHFRTRLTHTLEVAQIARDIARAMLLNEDLVEAVALAHDLGHPPFGHSGEDVLDELMKEHGGFEHNRQSLRIVDYLEHPYPLFRGLNLTGAVRESLAKHETRFDSPICEEFDLTEPAPLEGQLVDLADEIAYTTADLDDALGSLLLAPEDLQAESLWKDAWAKAELEYPDAHTAHKRIRATKALLGRLVDDAIATTNENLRKLGIGSLADVRAAGRRIVCFSPKTREALSELETFLLENVYSSGENIRQRRQAERILRELFAAYVSDPALLAERYQRRIEVDGLHRVVCDYVAGMTDRFCSCEHQRICGPAG